MRPDPFEALWESLVYRVHEQEDGGIETLSPDERLVWVVMRLRGEVDNGGFRQYFYNSSGEHAHEALAALRLLGATTTAEILSTAIGLCFPGGEVPTDSHGRRELLPQPWEGFELFDLDKRFWSDPDDLRSRIERFATGQGLLGRGE